MSGRVHGCVRIAASVLIALLAAARAAGQVPEDVPSLVVPVGPTLFHPFCLATIERTDNAFQRSARFRESATVSTVVPGFVFQLPFSHSRASFGYAVRRREYGLDRGEDPGIAPYAHYLRADTRLVFGTGWIVSFRDDFRRGALDTQIFEGGEVRFTGEKIESNHLTTEVAVERGGLRRLALQGERISDRVVGERRSGIYDLRENRLGLSGEHRLSPANWLLWEVEGRDGTRTRALDRRVHQELRGGAGLRRQIGTGTQLEAVLGAVHASGTSAELTGSLGARVPFDRTGVVAARLQREMYPSVLESPYFVANSAQLEVSTARDARLALGTSVGFFHNSYPEGGRGSDRTLAVETWIGYRFGRWIQSRLTVRGATRSSAVSEFGYGARSVAFQIGLGGS